MPNDTNEDERHEAQEKLDALLQEGLESGPSTILTPQDWIDIRQGVRQLAEEQARA